MSTDVTDLTALCRAHGITDEDSSSAIATYTARGALTVQERSWLAGMTEAERSATLADLFGADAARIAQIDYSQVSS